MPAIFDVFSDLEEEVLNADFDLTAMDVGQLAHLKTACEHLGKLQHRLQDPTKHRQLALSRLPEANKRLHQVMKMVGDVSPFKCEVSTQDPEDFQGGLFPSMGGIRWGIRLPGDRSSALVNTHIVTRMYGPRDSSPKPELELELRCRWGELHFLGHGGTDEKVAQSTRESLLDRVQEARRVLLHWDLCRWASRLPPDSGPRQVARGLKGVMGIHGVFFSRFARDPNRILFDDISGSSNVVRLVHKDILGAEVDVCLRFFEDGQHFRPLWMVDRLAWGNNLAVVAGMSSAPYTYGCTACELPARAQQAQPLDLSGNEHLRWMNHI